MWSASRSSSDRRASGSSPSPVRSTTATRSARSAVAGAEPVALWHGSHDLEGVDALVLPGGFSYGDYLRAGAIAALAPIMAEVKDAAADGMPILGICNGFQMLVEAHLLPGGLIRNAHQQFIRRDQRLRVENASTAWTSEFTAGPGDRHPAQERRRRIHRGCRDPGRSSRARVSSPSATSASTRTGRSTTSPASPTSAATSSASCRTPSTPSRRASARTPRDAMRSGVDGLPFFTSAIAAVVAAAA